MEDQGLLIFTKTGTEGGEKALGMIPGKNGFAESGFPHRLKCSQKDAGFYLGAGHLAGEVDGLELGSPDSEWRPIAGRFTENLRTELAERFGDATHGAAT